MTPKTIEIFLVEGDPKSVKTATITSRNVEVSYIPRKKLDLAKQRNSLSTVGIYMLVGFSEEHEKHEIYIGEAENCMTRLIQHNAAKDFWQYALVVTSRTNQFTKTHGKYLEWLACEEAKKANRCLINNSVTPAKPYVNESMEADLLDSFETISILVSTLGLPVFQSTREKQSSIDEDDTLTFSVQRKGVVGYGQYTSEGFVVLKGSKIYKTVTPSLASAIVKKRKILVEDCILIDRGDYYELAEDTLFNSPSYAAATVTGRSSNGWTAWTLKDGRNLSDIYRKQA